LKTVVIGGGPAGAAAAGLLARAGRAVTLYEREAGPVHKVCGDFVSAEAVAALAGLGVECVRLGAAPITHARFVDGRRVGTVRLPFTAQGLSRRALDAALLRAAEDAGAQVQRGVAVRTLRQAEDGFVLEGPDCACRQVLLGTGKHGLRGAPRPAAPGPLVGLKTYYRLSPAQTARLRGHVEIITYPGGYAGLQLVEDDIANLCLLADAGRLRAAGGPAALIAALAAAEPHLGARLDGAQALLDRPLAIAGLAYGHVHAAQAGDPPELFRLGDQAAVIPSLAGDGIAIALHSGALAAAALLAGADAAAYHARLRRDLRGQVGRAQAVHRAIARPAGRAVLVAAARLLPAVVRLGARATRVAACAAWP
jgi:flavin-dependent dehydrogenase